MFDVQRHTWTHGSTTSSSRAKCGSSNMTLLHSAPHCCSQLLSQYGIKRQQKLTRLSLVTTSSPVPACATNLETTGLRIGMKYNLSVKNSRLRPMALSVLQKANRQGVKDEKSGKDTRLLTWQKSIQSCMDDELLHAQTCSDNKVPQH